MEQQSFSEKAAEVVAETGGRQRYTMSPSNAPCYITMDQLRCKLGGRGRTSVYRDVEEGRLPKPLKFGARLYWRESDIDDRMAALIAEAA